jgi:hypothetical protein
MFEGTYNNPGEYYAISSDDEPLTGDDITMTTEVIQEYGTSLFFDPVPFHMLKTYETEP